jgi:Carbohydrate family 9 binding domain-like
MRVNIESAGIVKAMEYAGTAHPSEFPPAQAWERAQPICFDSDWQGRNNDGALSTQVRVLWTREMLYLEFRCRYRTLTVFDESDANGRRDQLWDRDVAEVFIQTDATQQRHYWEFEVSPNGMWIDLEISPEGKRDPKSGMKSHVVRNDPEKLWIAMLALPINIFITRFDPSVPWRVNFFRVEGAAEPRFYSCWRPTYTPQPNFHVPEVFGLLRFERA